MKKISVLSAICIIALTQIVSAQLHTESSSEDLRLGRPHPYPMGGPTGQVHTQHISFDDTIGPGNAGTYNPTDHFSVDLYLTFAGYDSPALSLWFATTANAAPNIFVTGFTWGKTFPDEGNASIASYPMGFNVLQQDGLYSNPNPSDFGGVVDDIHAPWPGPGTYFVGHLSISLNGLAPGIYTLQTDATRPHVSEVASFDGTTFHDEPIPVAAYTITIVPEPSTLALLVLAATGLGIVTRHRAVSKNTAIVGSGDSHRS